ncbi:uncharacterized protein LOC134691529 [Mytilus trossulus]|uniref:uncharacterized protein LOC134691529 n=1 Tax=Mytilus trossulus TaxID=6551 RepID=UPI003007E719
MKNIILELRKKYKDLLTLHMLCKPQLSFPEHHKDINSGNVSVSNHISQHGHDDALQNKINLPGTIQMAITDYPANLTKPNQTKSRKALPVLNEDDLTKIDITTPTPKTKDLSIPKHVETTNCETLLLENEHNVETAHSGTAMLETEQNVETAHSQTVVLQGEQNSKTTHGDTVVLEKCPPSENIQSTNIMKFVLIPVMSVDVNNPITKTTDTDAKKILNTSCVKSTGASPPFKGNMSDIQLISNKDKTRNNPPKNVMAASTTMDRNETDKQLISNKDKTRNNTPKNVKAASTTSDRNETAKQLISNKDKTRNNQPKIVMAASTTTDRNETDKQLISNKDREINSQTNNTSTAQILLNENIWTIQTKGGNHIYKVKRKYRDIQPCGTSIASFSSNQLDVNNIALPTTVSEIKKIDNLLENKEASASLIENMSEDTNMTVDDYNPNTNSSTIPTQLNVNEFTMNIRRDIKEKYKQTINSTTYTPFSVNTDNEEKEKYIDNKRPTAMVTRSGRVKISVLPFTDYSIMEEYTHDKAPTAMGTRSIRSEANTAVLQEDNVVMEGYTHTNTPIVTQSCQLGVKNTVIQAINSSNMEGITQNNTSPVMATRSSSTCRTKSIPGTDNIINVSTAMATRSGQLGVKSSIAGTDTIINVSTAMATRSSQSGVKISIPATDGITNYGFTNNDASTSTYRKDASIMPVENIAEFSDKDMESTKTQEAVSAIIDVDQTGQCMGTCEADETYHDMDDPSLSDEDKKMESKETSEAVKAIVDIGDADREDITSRRTDLKASGSGGQNDGNSVTDNAQKDTTDGFICDIGDCRKVFSTYKYLGVHKRKTHSTKTYACDVCGRGFPHKRYLKNHSKLHSDDKPYKCQVCGKQFRQKQNLTRHLKSHGDRVIETHTCDICGKVFRESSNLQAHVKTHTSENNFVCDLCGMTFKLKRYMVRHHNVKHSIQKQFTCEVCNKVFRQKVTLKNHMTTHVVGKMFVCEVCGQEFSQKGSIKRHMDRVHTGNTTCEICGIIVRPERLQKHLRGHTGEKAHKCQVCNREFDRKSAWLNHMKTHTGEKPHLCDLCGKGFSTTSLLNVHMRSHTGEKPFKCDICGKGFSQSGPLKTHKLIHTGLKPYICAVCGKGFTQPASLQQHRTTHLDYNAHHCDICSNTFKHRHSLLRHMLKRHNIGKHAVSKSGNSDGRQTVGMTGHNDGRQDVNLTDRNECRQAASMIDHNLGRQVDINDFGAGGQSTVDISRLYFVHEETIQNTYY